MIIGKTDYSYQSLTSQQTDLNSLLFHACQVDNLEAVENFLKQNADPNTKNFFNETPLLIACQKKNVKMILLLIRFGADPTIGGPNNITPLSYMCGTHMKDNEGNMILHWACEESQKEIVSLLLKSGADIGAKSNGLTPLIRACILGHKEIVSLLIEYGADKEAKDNSQDMTPLHWACSSAFKEIISLLIEKGADKEAKDMRGMTPLHWIYINKKPNSQKDKKELASLLIENGADFLVTDKNHKIAFDYDYEVAKSWIENLQVSKESVHSSLMKSEKTRKIDKRVQNRLILMRKDADGRTLLHWAAGRGKIEIVKLLLEKGVDRFVEDNYGKIPEDYASDSEVKEILKMNNML